MNSSSTTDLQLWSNREPVLLLRNDLVKQVQPSKWTIKRKSGDRAHLGQAEAQLGGEDMGEGHELGGLVGGVAEHVALVSRTNLLQGLGAQTMHTLTNVW